LALMPPMLHSRATESLLCCARLPNARDRHADGVARVFAVLDRRPVCTTGAKAVGSAFRGRTSRLWPQALESEKVAFEELVAHPGHHHRGGESAGRLDRYRESMRAHGPCDHKLGPMRAEVVREKVMIDIEPVAVLAEHDHR